jgi:spore maturation protein CgeB
LLDARLPHAFALWGGVSGRRWQGEDYDMRIAIFGLTVSSSWGNGHATLWRGLIKALARMGHSVTFFEKDVPYYANERDFTEVPGGELVLYESWQSVCRKAAEAIAEADIAIVTSYCPNAIEAGELIAEKASALAVFYDLDTPVTLARLKRGESIPYVGTRGLLEYDLVLSYTGGGALTALREELNARRVMPLYGHADPETHRPVPAAEHYRADLSYLGTYAQDRQPALERLFVNPARRRPALRFVIGGAQYPQDFPWSDNIYFVRHLPPPEHPAFFCSSRLTLNVTRRDMAGMGWCPSGRLFEAAACGTPVITDRWEGIETFYAPGAEMLTVDGTEDVLTALELSDAELAAIARAARERTLAEHTSAHRAAELLAACEVSAGAAERDQMSQLETDRCGA